MIFNKEKELIGFTPGSMPKIFRDIILYLVHSYELRPYGSSVQYYIYLYTCVIIYNTCYLLFILKHAMVLFLGLEIIH